MVDVLGVVYLTPKEMSQRYGHSKSWFDKRRGEKKEPIFVKMLGKGKILYPLKETDEWFKNSLYVSQI